MSSQIYWKGNPLDDAILHHNIVASAKVYKYFPTVNRWCNIASWKVCFFLQKNIKEKLIKTDEIQYSNITSSLLFANKRVIYRLGIISLAHALVHVTDFPVVNVPVDELSSTRIGQHKLCATLSANVNINYCLPIKAYYRIYTRRHIRIEIN